ncbi:MAG: T9SS type A sorting domain-containing protein [Ignavibacteriae bacterium]|nr:T9SS type A sorting domain-containing protein [Ignavibacteriota bacterium]
MKKLKSLIILLLLFIASTSFGLDTNSIKYMPLHVGDFWVYNGYTYQVPGGPTYWIEKLSVISSRAINNHIYCYLVSNRTPSYLPFKKEYLRVDSITGSSYKYDSTGWCSNYYFEMLSDSLAAVYGDSIKNCGIGYYKCIGNSKYFLFGDSITTINYYSHIGWGGGSYSIYQISFSQNYGLSKYSNNSSGGGTFGSLSYTLKGCKINGILYGDTSTVSILNISTETPSKYSLSQNYPNPFNPSTVIRFQLSVAGDVSLRVYDVMGREVQTLVIERLQAGTYEVKFDGSMLMSGVYFYKMVTEGFTDTKRMLLIK